MLTVIWVYERPDQSKPFFSDAPEFSDDQKILEDMISNSGNVLSYNKTVSNNGLVQTATVIYENKEKYQKQLDLNTEKIPAHSTNRTNYVLENNHKITAVATDDIFLMPNGAYLSRFTLPFSQ